MQQEPLAPETHRRMTLDELKEEVDSDEVDSDLRGRREAAARFRQAVAGRIWVWWN